MSLTRQQKLKKSKTKARERKLRKVHNVLMNAPSKRYRLDVLYNGVWQAGVKRWSGMKQVEAHVKDTECRRVAGEEIIEGKVFDTLTGAVILSIPASKAKGVAPDKIEDGVKAAEII
jgi:hypothetical protein